MYKYIFIYYISGDPSRIQGLEIHASDKFQSETLLENPK